MTILSFSGIQIKSLEAFKRFAASVDEIENVCGIHEVTVELKDIFFCPWIDIEQCRGTYMERLIIGIIEKMNG